jgi:pimeloyl-ACP methyl ester carboxylesterase
MAVEALKTDDPLSPEQIGRASQSIRIAPGRDIGIAEFGPRKGPAVIYFHGFPSCRVEPAILDIPGVRIIGIDRPGYGLSDAAPWNGAPLAEFACDVAAVADHLGLERFALFGMSGGAPYATAVAAAYPQRVSALALVSGLGPPEAPGMSEGRVGLLRALGQSGRPGRLVFTLARRTIRSESATAFFLRFRRIVAEFECARDAEAFTDVFAYRLMTCWREALRRSAHGALADAKAYGTPWPFRLEDIRVPTCIYHGLEDRIVPASIGQFAAQRIPRAQSHLIGSEGHISLIVNHWNAIMADLLRHT